MDFDSSAYVFFLIVSRFWRLKIANLNEFMAKFETVCTRYMGCNVLFKGFG